MENPSNQATRKGLILLLGIIIGLLTGVLVAFIVESKIRTKSPDVVKVIAPEKQGQKDTVYKYIVHQYRPTPEAGNPEMAADTLPHDSTLVDEYSVDFMLDVDDEDDDEPQAATVSSERMVARQEAPVLYFDANKNAIAAPDNAMKFMEVQFWSTPIHNKTTYLLKDNILRIKGLKINDVYIIHYKGHYYLQSDRHVYQILPGTAYQRLTELGDTPFL